MIPTFQMGDVVFSATFTRFAADSMSDVSGELARIVEMLACAYQDAWYQRAQDPSVDKPAMVAAARYSQWISDKLLWEIAYWQQRDLQIAEAMVADHWPEEADWYRVQQQAIEQPARR
jgi:hypothetical protein